MRLARPTAAVLAAALTGSCVPSRDAASDASRDREPSSDSAQLESTPDTAVVAHSLGEAEALYRRGEYDSAREALEPLLRTAQSESDSVSEALVLTLLGQTAYRQGDYPEARALSERALQLKLAVGLEEELHRSYNALGLIAWNQSRLMEALELFDRTLETAGEEDRTKAVVSLNRGLVQTDLGEFEEARIAFETAGAVSRRIGDARLEGMALNNRAMLSIWAGNPAEAVDLLAEATELYQSVDFRPGELNALGQLGSAYAELGEIGRAIAALDSAIALSRDFGMRQELASNIETLAEALRTAGHYQRALDLYAEAGRINSEIGLIQETGSNQRSRADIYASLGELSLARTFAEEALRIHREVDARWEELADLVLLADIVHELGEPEAAEGYLAAGRQLAQDFNARVARLQVALAVMRIADRAERSRLVLRTASEAGEDLLGGGYDVEWEAAVLQARAYHRLGRLDSAVVEGRAAVEAVERVRTGLNSPSSRTLYATERSLVYSTLVAILLELQQPDEAFQVAASARGRPLLEQLAVIGEAPSRHPGVAALLESERVLRRIAELESRILELEGLPEVARDGGPLTVLMDHLAQSRRDYEGLRIRLAERNRKEAALLGGLAVDSEEIRAALRPDEALLQYFVTTEESLVFLVRRDAIQAFKIPVAQNDLSRRVRLARQLLGDPEMEGSIARDVLAGLFGLLIEPVARGESLTGVSRLIVVPHGVLAYLPFAALLDEPAGRYLAERYDVEILPSAAALAALREDAAIDQPGASAVALAPFPSLLPGTREEAIAVRRSLPGSESVEGASATEQRLRQALQQASIVHVATHGILNARSPLFSRLELAEGSGAFADDGRLHVHEMLDLEVRSRLLFLSGCETGVGPSWSTEFERGEEYATLAQALLLAGATSVIATLWPVEDEGAAEFATRFYSELGQDGTDPVAAIAATQRALIRDSRYSAPYYWAAYQVMGVRSTGS